MLYIGWKRLNCFSVVKKKFQKSDCPFLEAVKRQKKCVSPEISHFDRLDDQNREKVSVP